MAALLALCGVMVSIAAYITICCIRIDRDAAANHAARVAEWRGEPLGYECAHADRVRW